MPDPKPRKIKQYAPVKFGEPFNPKSVEGAQLRRRQAAAIRRRKEEEAELAKSTPGRMRKTPASLRVLL